MRWWRQLKRWWHLQRYVRKVKGVIPPNQHLIEQREQDWKPELPPEPPLIERDSQKTVVARSEPPLRRSTPQS